MSRTVEEIKAKDLIRVLIEENQKLRDENENYYAMVCSMKDHIDLLMKEQKNKEARNVKEAVAEEKQQDDRNKDKLNRCETIIRTIYSKVKAINQEAKDVKKSFETMSQQVGQQTTSSISEIMKLVQVNQDIWYEEIEQWKEKNQILVKETSESLRSQAGYLLKQGKAVKNWKRRWFVFREDLTFSYYGAYEDKKPLNTVDLSKEKAIEVKPDISQGKAFTFKLVTKDRTFYFSATNEEEKQRWMIFVKRWFDINRSILTSASVDDITLGSNSYSSYSSDSDDSSFDDSQ